jgi:hypothetical protein
MGFVNCFSVSSNNKHSDCLKLQFVCVGYTYIFKSLPPTQNISKNVKNIILKLYLFVNLR